MGENCRDWEWERERNFGEKKKNERLTPRQINRQEKKREKGRGRKIKKCVSRKMDLKNIKQ